MAKVNDQKKTNGSALDFEAQLWAVADKMRGHMDASEYKHVWLGLVFLKYISDAFEEKRDQLLFGFSDPKNEWFIKDEPQRAEAAENRDEYLAANVFWLPPEARWHTIKAKAKSPEIGKVIDDAMGAIERENPSLKGVLPRDYARPSLDKVRLGGLVDIISNIGFNEPAARSKDVLGRVYEYFLGKFASAEGKGGGEFYTPQCVVQVLVAMLEPYKGRVFDPCCGSGGMFVQSEKFVEEHGGRVGDIAVYGQESNYTTWKLARMNLAIRGIDANLGPRNADSFRADLHPDLKADFIRDHQGEVLFIDAREMGQLVDRIHRELTEAEINRIANVYHNWKCDWGRTHDEATKRNICLDLPPPYADEPGFCKSVKLEELRTHGYVLTPGRYVGAADVEDDGEPLEQKMKRLTETLEAQFAESAKLETAIRQNFKSLSRA